MRFNIVDRYTWYRWFAWYPVKLTRKDQVVWLEFVMKKDIPLITGSIRSEYKEIE